MNIRRAGIVAMTGHLHNLIPTLSPRSPAHLAVGLAALLPHHHPLQARVPGLAAVIVAAVVEVAVVEVAVEDGRVGEFNRCASLSA